MFKSPGSRTALRAGLAVAIAVLASLRSSIGDGLTGEEVINLIEVAVGGAAVWLGVGALTPTEPFFGSKGDEKVEVPADQAKLTT